MLDYQLPDEEAVKLVSMLKEVLKNVDINLVKEFLLEYIDATVEEIQRNVERGNFPKGIAEGFISDLNSLKELVLKVKDDKTILVTAVAIIKLLSVKWMLVQAGDYGGALIVKTYIDKLFGVSE